MNRLNAENIQVTADALTVPVSYFFEDAKEADRVAGERKLMRHFRKIKNNNYKNIVIHVARLVTVEKK